MSDNNFNFQPAGYQSDAPFVTTTTHFSPYPPYNLVSTSGPETYQNAPIFQGNPYTGQMLYDPSMPLWPPSTIPLRGSTMATDVLASQTTQLGKTNPTQAAVPLYDQRPHKRQRSNDFGSRQNSELHYHERPGTKSISTCCSSCSDGVPCMQPECSPEREEMVECNRESCSQPCNNTCDFGRTRVDGQGSEGWACALEPQIDGASWGAPSWESYSTMTYNPLNATAPNNTPFSIDPQLMKNHATHQAHAQQLQYVPIPMDNSRHTTPSLGIGLATPNSMGFDASPSFPNQDPPLFDATDNSMLSGTGTMFHGGVGVVSNGETNNFSCYWDNCNTDFSDPNALHKHFHNSHLDPVLKYSCPVPLSNCPEIVGTDPVEHLVSHHGWQENNCPDSVCQESGPEYCDPSQLHNHFDQEHSIQPQEGLACKWQSCTAIIPGVMGLSEHLQSQHNFHITVTCDEEIDLTAAAKEAAAANSLDQSSILPNRNGSPDKEEVVTLTCQWQMEDGSICGATKFGKEAPKELQEHIGADHLQQLSSKTGFFCRWKDCRRETNKKLDDKGFSQRGKLYRHMASHTTYKCCQCDICGERFSAPQALKQHTYLHTNEKPWKCQFCPKAFPQQSAKTIHERTHTGYKPLVCEVCGNRFAESSNLTKHRKTHGDKGSNVCSFPGCGKAFHRLDQLRRHNESHRTPEQKRIDKARKNKAGDDDTSSLCTSTFDEGSITGLN